MNSNIELSGQAITKLREIAYLRHSTVECVLAALIGSEHDTLIINPAATATIKAQQHTRSEHSRQLHAQQREGSFTPDHSNSRCPFFISEPR